MENKGKVSVIVPVYNAESYLGRCVESLLHQSYTNFELLLVDDGSTDESSAICDAYSRLDKRVRAFHQQNAGPSAARNRGIDKSQGRWICFVDADDYVEENYLAGLISSIEQERMLVVQGLTEVDDRGEVIRTRLLPSICYDYRDFGRMFESHNLMDHGFTVAKLYPLSLLRKHRIRFNEQIQRAEDLTFFLKMLSVSEKVKLISCSNYNYVTSNSVLSIARFSCKSEKTLFRELKEIFDKHSKQWTFNKAALFHYYALILMQCVIGAYLSTVVEPRGERLSLLRDIRTIYKDEWKSYTGPILMNIINAVVRFLPITVSDALLLLLRIISNKK